VYYEEAIFKASFIAIASQCFIMGIGMKRDGVGKMFEQHANHKNYEKKVVNYIRKNWHSRIKNEKELTAYKGKDLEASIKKNPEFMKTVMYIAELFESSEWNNRAVKLPTFHEKIRKELVKWEENGELCLYLSVACYALLEKSQVFNDREMKLIQGYFLHKPDTDNALARMMGDTHVGIHAWISIKGSVLDLSIGQERDFFNFNEVAVVMGKVPEGMTFKGYQEPKKVLQKHIQKYAKFAELSEEEWRQLHLNESNKKFAEFLQEE